jgi:excisionase family DNA binding protein
MIRIREAAELLGVSDDTVRRWIDDGSLSVSQDESSRMVIAGDVLAEFARANATRVRPPQASNRGLSRRTGGSRVGGSSTIAWASGMRLPLDPHARLAHIRHLCKRLTVVGASGLMGRAAGVLRIG